MANELTEKQVALENLKVRLAATVQFLNENVAELVADAELASERLVESGLRMYDFQQLEAGLDALSVAQADAERALAHLINPTGE